MTLLSQVVNPPLSLPESLWQMLDRSDDKHLAVSVLHQPAAHLSDLIGMRTFELDYLSWTFAQLRRAVFTVSTNFVNQGVERGSVLFTFLSNGVETIIMVWISALLQLTLVPLDSNILHPARNEQLEHHLRKSDDGKGIVVVSDRAAAERVEETLHSMGRAFQAKYMTEIDSIPGWTSLAEISWSDRVHNDSRLDQVRAIDQHGDRTAAVLHTSGTSNGKPKGCPLSVGNIMAAGAVDCGLAQLTDCFMTSFLNTGVIFTMMVFVCGARSMELLMPSAKFSAADTMKAIEQCASKSITTICIPAQIQLLKNESRHRGSSKSLRNVERVMLGGDLASEDVLRQAAELFSSARLSTSHGMTEACGTLGFRNHSIDKMPSIHGLASVGKPAVGSNVRIVRSVEYPSTNTTRTILPRGEPGDLHVGGPCVISRYVDNVEPESFYHDEIGNWLITGDRAMMDDDGFVFILGRTKDIIKRMGQSLSPAMVEAVLRNLLNVEAAAVLGIPHQDFGEVPVAVLESRVGTRIDKKGVQSAAAASLGEHYTLEHVFELEDLGLHKWPLNPTGKVMKVALKANILSRLKARAD